MGGSCDELAPSMVKKCVGKGDVENVFEPLKD